MKSERALVRLTWQSVLGGFAASLSTIFGAIAGMVLVGMNAAEIARNVAAAADKTVRVDNTYDALLVAPVLETFLFLIAFKLLEAMKLARERRSAMLALALTMGIIGWLVHGASFFTVAQAFGFAVLGALFGFLWFGSGSRSAFGGTALAHMIWNASLLCLALVYSPHAVWESRVFHPVSDRTRVDVVGSFETLDRCRSAGLLHLNRLQARYKAQQQQDARSKLSCERKIRSGWYSD